MTKSAALLSSVALLSLVAAFGGCSSSGAASAPGDGTGASLGGPNGTGADGSNGTAGYGAGSTELNPSGATATQGAGGDNGSSVGGSTGETGATGAGGIGTGATGTSGDGSGATGVGGAPPTGGSHTVDVTGGVPSSGGQGTSIDVTGGQGTSIDATGGQGTSIDATGGQGTSIDLTGGQGTSIDLTGGQGTSIDLTGGKGTNIDLFGGTGNTTDTTGGVGIPPPPPDSGTPPPGCVPTWFAKQINVLVLHDAHVSNADTRGAMWVGGNLTGVGYDVGGDLPPDPTCTRYDLAVGGNLTLSGYLVMHNGAAAYGGTISVAGVTGANCGVYHAPSDMPNFTQIAADVKGNSTYFNGLPDNGTVSGTTFNGASASCKIVVFHTTLCAMGGITINIPANGTAIINSSCTNPSFTGGGATVIMGGVTQPQCNGQQGTGGACNHILYNFPNATSINVTGTAVQGSILAPYAKFTGDGGNVDGEVVVDSMDTGIEFHAWFFEGCLDTTNCK
jgi:choice-of-anchor A domain-containing protein